MTINSQVLPVTIAQGDGTTTSFQTSFQILAAEHLSVTLFNESDNTKTLATPLNIAGVGDTNGVTFDLSPAPNASTKIVMVDNVPLTQEIDFVAGETIRLEVFQEFADKTTQQIKQIAANVGKTVRLASDAPEESLDILPERSARRESVLGFDQEGDLVVKLGADNHALAAETARMAAEAAQATTEAQIPLVQAEGATQIAAVQAETVTQIAAVQAEATTQITAATAEADRALAEADRALSEADRAQVAASFADALLGATGSDSSYSMGRRLTGSSNFNGGRRV